MTPIRVRPELSRQPFIREEVRWLVHMARLQTPSKPSKPYEGKIIEYADFILHERGHSPRTIEPRLHAVPLLLDQLCDGVRKLDNVAVLEIDSTLAARVNEGRYTRVTVQTHASSLR